MGIAEDLGSLVIKSHTTNQVKITSERVEIDTYTISKKNFFS